MKLSEWKGPWPVVCRLSALANRDLRDVDLIDKNGTILSSTNSVTDNRSPEHRLINNRSHWDVVDWFEEDKPLPLPDLSFIGESIRVLKELYEKPRELTGLAAWLPKDYSCSVLNVQPVTMNSCAEPACVCNTPQAHDAACAWMAWRRGQ